MAVEQSIDSGPASNVHSSAQPAQQGGLPAEASTRSRPLHRRGLYDDARLEEIFRRRVERLVQRPPSKMSRRLQVINYALMFGVGSYMVLYQDYGDRPHCFTGLRKWYFGKVDKMWTLSSEEEKELRERGQLK
ncbi:hypothetical protein GGI15_003613 [Coemansia interrupta]|uniref:Uncharacterized protein n=1 Tax=Coemansia interrupta TaxID=1126814 RepID=A0A9W8LI77_9FUNG|nr:hypothetical protein GGI15_003613 [Coemansia interrupta]